MFLDILWILYTMFQLLVQRCGSYTEDNVTLRKSEITAHTLKVHSACCYSHILVVAYF